MSLRTGIVTEQSDLIGQVLLDAGYISPQQLKEAMAGQEASPAKRLGEILIELGYLSTERLEKGLALQSLERELRERQTSKLRSRGKGQG